MGWADCGLDSKGRPIGYAFSATCDHPGCDKKIDRGLSFACGGMHGETEWGCEGYFCEEHLEITDKERDSQLCPSCVKRVELKLGADWYEKSHSDMVAEAVEDSA